MPAWTHRSPLVVDELAAGALELLAGPAALRLLDRVLREVHPVRGVHRRAGVESELDLQELWLGRLGEGVEHLNGAEEIDGLRHVSDDLLRESGLDLPALRLVGASNCGCSEDVPGFLV